MPITWCYHPSNQCHLSPSEALSGVHTFDSGLDFAMRAELLCPNMEANASNVHTSYRLGPRGPNLPHGPPQACHEPNVTAQEPTGGPRLEEQQQSHKPLFYMQPSPPYMPMQGLQWPYGPMAMPVGYNPYYGCHALGFGMPMMPHYQPNPYMEPPGFVMPHTNLHLTDYRRVLNSQYYQTTAYHARRYRYQHNVPAREVTNSEVQTEPLCSDQRISTPGSGDPEASACDVKEALSAPLSKLLPMASTEQSNEHSPDLRDVVASCAASSPPNRSFVIHSEEVRIECCTTPGGLQLFHAHDASEASHGFPHEIPLGDRPGIPAEQTPQACPDILLVGIPSEKNPEPEESKNHPDSFTDFVEEMRSEKDQPMSSKNIQSEVLLQDKPVWSMEETLFPCPDSPVQNILIEDHSEVSADIPTKEAPAPSGEGFKDGADMMDEEDVPLPATSPLLGSSHKEEENQPRQDPNFNDDQDTSFESLPAYLPSSSWIAAGGKGCWPPTPKKPSQPVTRSALSVLTRRRKLEMEQPSVRKPKEKYKPKAKVDRRSLSDHECCLTRTLNENICAPYKNDRLCSRCLDKPHGPGLNGRVLKRKAAPFQQCNGALQPTCDACRFHTKKRLVRNGSFPDVRGPRHEAEGESSENGPCRVGLKWRPEQKRPPGSKQNLDKAPAAMREKNCRCDGVWRVQPVPRECRRHCPHGNAIRELDENLPAPTQDRWRRTDQVYWTHRWQTEKSWKTVTTIPEVWRHEPRPQHLTKHRMSQSQGTRRKDTRC
ncbi:uncharacterized protein LOC133630377 [Entelurus aequoreus]|uniref:uncharacterized protein LOC133630377 n=1 Tax=Entelurus aequoreus TaxID=161455 RepID=UPI002B1E8F51|nr:uncharacterized protein LOC133630377 [Entelurus aequoreus]